MPMIHGAIQDYPLTLDKFVRHAARWHPNAQVVTAREDGTTDRIGYRDLMGRALRVSDVLRGLGIGKGDHVATLAWNSQAHVESWYGIVGIGAICHTLNPRLTDAQLADMIGQSQARVLIASADLEELAGRIALQAPGVEHLLLIDGDDAHPGALSPKMAAVPGDSVWGDFDETIPCGLCFTSGTTGAPKGVTYTHRGTFLHTLRSLQADVMAFRRTDAVLAVVPMFHANAWGLPFAIPAVGGKLVLPGRQADGESLARLIAAEGVTIGVGVPTVWLGLVDYLDAAGIELPSLERIVVGGMPLTPALMARIEQRLGVTVQTSWGMTELSPSGTVAVPNDPARIAEASGRVAIGVDLLLTDAEGMPLPQQTDVEGHLRVRGAAVVERYFGQDAPAVDARGWFPTGDLARFDGEGNLFITGRAKDLIKSGGEWINPAEIEAVIGANPQVALAAVIGRPDPKWGERPILLVQIQGDESVTDEALLAPLRGRVAPWWLPDEIVRVADIPLAPTGKIDKTRLRSEYGSG